MAELLQTYSNQLRTRSNQLRTSEPLGGCCCLPVSPTCNGFTSNFKSITCFADLLASYPTDTAPNQAAINAYLAGFDLDVTIPSGFAHVAPHSCADCTALSGRTFVVPYQPGTTTDNPLAWRYTESYCGTILTVQVRFFCLGDGTCQADLQLFEGFDLNVVWRYYFSSKLNFAGLNLSLPLDINTPGTRCQFTGSGDASLALH